jgi:hypothetical protein
MRTDYKNSRLLELLSLSNTPYIDLVEKVIRAKALINEQLNECIMKIVALECAVKGRIDEMIERCR